MSVSEPFAERNFTVHEYHNSKLPLRTSQNSVLNQGYQLVKTLSSSCFSWKADERGSAVEYTRFKNSFTLREAPPTLGCKGEEARFTKEWGAPITKDEIFNMSDLEEFKGTDLTRLLLQRFVTTSNIRAQNKRREPQFLEAEPPSKRRKVNSGSLYNIIPQPHIHPSPFISSEMPLKGRSFTRAEPIFLSPDTVCLADDVRVAWLVPVRGLLPWTGCTSAVILDFSNDSELLSSSDSGIEDSIVWTEPSLRQFWEFLLELRDSSTLGPLAISFHTSQRNRRSLSIFEHPTGLLHPQAEAVTLASPQARRSSLSALDYIKIYHDSQRWSHLRSALDIWSYAVPATSQKVRLFQDSRFVLVNDVSQGILIS